MPLVDGGGLLRIRSSFARALSGLDSNLLFSSRAAGLPLRAGEGFCCEPCSRAFKVPVLAALEGLPCLLWFCCVILQQVRSMGGSHKTSMGQHFGNACADLTFLQKKTIENCCGVALNCFLPGFLDKHRARGRFTMVFKERYLDPLPLLDEVCRSYTLLPEPCARPPSKPSYAMLVPTRRYTVGTSGSTCSKLAIQKWSEFLGCPRGWQHR